MGSLLPSVVGAPSTATLDPTSAVLAIFDSIVNYFAQDPLKILYALGGSGGLIYWWDRYRNRPRLRVRLLDEQFEVRERPYLEITTRFEVENVGTEKTSLEPEVLFTGYTVKRQRHRGAQKIAEEDRALPPFTPRTITLVVREEANYPFLWFRTYVFRLTRGRRKRVRIRSEDRVRLSYPKFLYELAVFRAFNRLPEVTRGV